MLGKSLDSSPGGTSELEKGKVEISYSSYTINKGLDDKIFEKDS